MHQNCDSSDYGMDMVKSPTYYGDSPSHNLNGVIGNIHLVRAKTDDMSYDGHQMSLKPSLILANTGSQNILNPDTMSMHQDANNNSEPFLDLVPPPPHLVAELGRRCLAFNPEQVNSVGRRRRRSCQRGRVLNNKMASPTGSVHVRGVTAEGGRGEVGHLPVESPAQRVDEQQRHDSQGTRSRRLPSRIVPRSVLYLGVAFVSGEAPHRVAGTVVPCALSGGGEGARQTVRSRRQVSAAEEISPAKDYLGW